MSRAKPRRRRGEGRAAFLAVVEEVRLAIRAGWPQVCVYDKHREELGISKRQFDRYIRRFVRCEDVPVRGQECGQQKKALNTSVRPPPAGARLPTFQFDPDAKDLKKLIG